jgi:MFS transporter, PPP family, 3-phenylpropionic acid transporter
LRSPGFLLLLLAAGLAQASHAVFYTFGTLHWRALGLSTAWSGTLWAISIVAEVALFAYSAAVVRRIGPAQLIVLGAGAAVIRWFIMGLDPPLSLLLPLQILHALTFGATHIGAIHCLGRAVPETQAGTAQALYSFLGYGRDCHRRRHADRGAALCGLCGSRVLGDGAGGGGALSAALALLKVRGDAC